MRSQTPFQDLYSEVLSLTYKVKKNKYSDTEFYLTLTLERTLADLKTKDITKLDDWNAKELRKLRMTINNRINEFENSSKQKELAKSNPLAELNPDELKELLEKVLKAEKNL